MENLNPAYAISPIDGRYSEQTVLFQYIFSEFALMKNRVTIEVKYIVALVQTLARAGDKYVKAFENKHLKILRSIYENFSDKDFEEIKKFESITGHDVKAVEYFIRNKFKLNDMEKYIPYVHLGLTSEDIDNITRSIGLIKGTFVLYNEYNKTILAIKNLAIKGKDVPMLARTHGQPATPSKVGWTMIVPKKRLEKNLKKFSELMIPVKFGGATGGNNAKMLAYPEIDWRDFNEAFVSGLNEKDTTNVKLCVNHYTFQIEPHDTYKELFEIFTGLNTILIDFCRNMWMYISQEHFVQIPKDGEVGSSALPQKVNPIHFENGEGNLAYANAILEFFSRNLPISRGYRDLSDSTVERNFGVPFAHIMVALKSIQKGLSRVKINESFLGEELENHWETITEGYQVVLRSVGVEKGYELMMNEVRGKKITKKILHGLVDKIASEFKLDPLVVEKLKSLTPHNYVGNRDF